ncbi:Derlin [Schizosaccharomyces pombe]|uniref:Uncharacterized derlin-like protein C365.08c n=1 Tax=Schizosaccharomyces pombe (strain 972 / ATCC 24843) TaxID=284812 RepID=YGR8_SCHPO|nr:putative Der1 family protein [Schizosaccharomyces pombe]Q9Y7Y0.1 RecName: Full=Uncharacterized derlin-like protein C365.08c [Schizosaccharomyces pombe 972h-]CAB44760.1 Der1-like (degradation in the ER) family (predicted) [Schizosaccharomyces pombe]|eukprot:NP_596037.1 putative Der1 family protein [Schizosaccharomyces pombe]
MASEFSGQIQELLSRIPPVTRYILLGTAATTILTLCQLLSPSMLVLHYPLVVRQKQWYRLFTNYLYAGTGFDFIMNIYFFYQYSTYLENFVFARNAKKYIIYLVKVALLIDAFSLISGLGSALNQSLAAAIAYNWSLFNSFSKIQFLFGFHVQGKYLPYVLLGFSFLTGGLPSLVVLGFGIISAMIVNFFDSIHTPVVHRSNSPKLNSQKVSGTFIGKGKKLGT